MIDAETSPTVALITGAGGAIGLAIARRIAARPGHRAVLLCRDERKAERAVRAIRDSLGQADVSYVLADLASLASIRALADTWRGPLHVLVNNAAIVPRERETTEEGIERQFAVNVLGYCRLTRALTPVLIESAPARIVNVASYWAGDLDLDDLEFVRRGYDRHGAYRQSKQANRMLTVACAERLAPCGVTVDACHPGDVSSALSDALGFGGHETPDEGADTPVWLALDRAPSGTTGKYFEHRREVRCRYGEDRARVAALDEICARYDKLDERFR